jgi:hypothetical protein
MRDGGRVRAISGAGCVARDSGCGQARHGGGAGQRSQLAQPGLALVQRGAVLFDDAAGEVRQPGEAVTAVLKLDREPGSLTALFPAESLLRVERLLHGAQPAQHLGGRRDNRSTADRLEPLLDPGTARLGERRILGEISHLKPFGYG